MTRLLAPALVVLLSVSAAMAQHWERVADHFGATVWGMSRTSSGRFVLLTENGAYHSMDGRSWRRSAGIARSVSLSGMAEAAPGVLVAGGNVGGVVRSTDDGLTWAASGAGVEAGAIAGVVAVPASTEMFLISGGVVYRSSDDGATWGPAGLSGANGSIVADASGVVYAAVGRGVKRSLPGAREEWSWTDSTVTTVSARLQSVGGALWAFDGFFGAHRSTDGGASWDSIPMPSSFVRSIQEMPSGLVAVTARGAWRTNDPGLTWSVVADTANGTPITALWYDAEGVLRAGTEKGIFTLPSEPDAPWQVAADGVENATVTGIVTAGGFPFSELTIESMGVVSARMNGSGQWRSGDIVAQITRPGIVAVRAYAVDSSVGQRRVVVAASRVGLAVSSDGIAWSAAPTRFLRSLPEALASNSRALFAGLDSGYVARTTDGGTTWTLALVGGAVVSDIAVRGDTVWVLTARGLHRSTNSGESYETIDPFMVGLSIALGPSGEVYVGTPFGTVNRSLDAGATWVPVTVATGNLPAISEIAANGRGIVFAGTAFGGMFASTDRGATWTARNGGLSGPGINAIVFDADDFAYVGTNRDGLFRSLQSTARVKEGREVEALDLR